jgi:hypothetical protein
MPNKTTAKKKSRKMDKKLVSNEAHEIKYVAKKKRVSQKKVREAKRKVGRSRKKVEQELS